MEGCCNNPQIPSQSTCYPSRPNPQPVANSSKPLDNMSELFDDVLFHLLSREDLPPLLPKTPYDEDLGRQITLLHSLQLRNIPGYEPSKPYPQGQAFWNAMGDEETKAGFRNFFQKVILLYLLNDEPWKADALAKFLLMEKKKQEDVSLWLQVMIAKKLDQHFLLPDLLTRLTCFSSNSTSPIGHLLSELYSSSPKAVRQFAERCAKPPKALKEEMLIKNREELVMMVRIVVGELPDLRRDQATGSVSEGAGEDAEGEVDSRGSSFAALSDKSSTWEASQVDSDEDSAWE